MPNKKTARIVITTATHRGILGVLRLGVFGFSARENTFPTIGIICDATIKDIRNY